MKRGKMVPENDWLQKLKVDPCWLVVEPRHRVKITFDIGPLPSNEYWNVRPNTKDIDL